MTPVTRTLVCLIALARAASCGAEPNVLFIAVDDLRPQLGCYGVGKMHTPNIDKLASRGVLFDKAYCMVPTCGASRASLMTGIRPTPTRFVTHLARADKEAPGVTTMNTHFQRNGYHTVSLGKVFHHTDDSAAGWSIKPLRPGVKGTYRLEENQRIAAERSEKLGKRGRGPAFEGADAADDEYTDGVLAQRAVETLRRLKGNKKPFFLAVGFVKPHLPFVCPKKYWDLYDEADIRVPENYHAPKDAPAESLHNSGELRQYYGIPGQRVLPKYTARKLIHGYYACVSFVDAQIGKVLDELDRLGLRDERQVVLPQLH